MGKKIPELPLDYVDHAAITYSALRYALHHHIPMWLY